MPLAPGVRLGSYEVLAQIGAGGMGEVYRARDTRLNRDVAVKVLPEAVATDADRLARFRREAEALAALNHPGIAQIYGLEMAGAQPAIVMELVQGDDLSVRIAREPIPRAESLGIARQLASALDAAHERGIVHRDLKPANIKITDDSVVKVLDFGLAKAIGPEPAGASGETANSPTLTARATAIGMILGTAAYMAPEQAKGRAVDRRADIWAFGAVLFEMLSGRRAFEGDDVAEVLASVIKTDPPWEALPADLPPAVSRLVRRCLEKDPRRRLRDISEGMLQLDEGLAQPVRSAPAHSTRPLWRRIAPIAAAVIATAAGVWWISRVLTPASPSSGAIRITTKPALSLSANPRPHIAIAPDGRIVFRGRDGARDGLFVKHPNAFDSAPIEGANGTTPFVSPDGEWLGFVQSSPPDNLLFKVPMRGGPRTPIAVAPGRTYGADWGPDGTIVFGSPLGLFKVPPGTDKPVALTTAEATSTVGGWHSWPSFAGSAGLVLFTIGRNADAKLAVVDMASGKITELGVSGTAPRYLPTGHLVFVTSEGVLRAAPFDLGRIKVTGDAVPLESGVRLRPGSGAADFDVSDSGTLVYISAVEEIRVPVWVNRSGAESPIQEEARTYTFPRLTRDGQRLLLATPDREQSLWIWDFAHPGMRLFMRNVGASMEPVWSPDGATVFFPFVREGRATIQRLNADGSGQPVQLADSARVLVPHAVVPGGSALIVRHDNDIALLTLGPTPKFDVLVADAMNPALSPDGRWLAYDSSQSGSREVYVRPFPKINDGEWTISSGNGWTPVWSSDGSEIFYMSGDLSSDQMMSVTADKGPTFSTRPPRVLFSANAYPASGLGRHFDVARDGRFVMLKRIERSEPVVRIVYNWFDEVRARVRPRGSPR